MWNAICEWYRGKPLETNVTVTRFNIRELNKQREKLVHDNITVALAEADKMAVRCHSDIERHYLTYGQFPNMLDLNCPNCYKTLPELCLNRGEYIKPQQIAIGTYLQYVTYMDTEGGEFGPEEYKNWTVIITAERFTDPQIHHTDKN